MKLLLTAVVAAVALAGCGGDAPVAEPGTPPVGPGAGVPADGGLSVAEAKASTLEEPLLVRGYLVAEGEIVQLCDLLLESFPPQCGGESLMVEGLDLGAHETRSEGEVRWTDTPVAVLGGVEGDTLHVSDTDI